MMRHAFTGIKLAIFLAVLSAGPGFAQSTSDEAISGATTVAPVAYVYVPTPHGIYAYKTSSAGMLTIIKGSPFTKTVGLPIGGNGKYFITLGTNYVHSYAVAADGAIGDQVSKINTQDYIGAECGNLTNVSRGVRFSTAQEHICM
jgi:hypothetical protein